MKKLILIMLSMILLTGCTGKENDEGQATKTPENQSTATPDVESSALPQDSNADNANSTGNDDKEKTLRSDFIEFPSNILEYAKENSMEIKEEEQGYLNYPVNDIKEAIFYEFYYEELEDYVNIGAILDYTDENNPKLVYHNMANSLAPIVQRGDGMEGYSMLGDVFVVKYDDDGEVVSFELPDEILLVTYGDIWETLE